MLNKQRKITPLMILTILLLNIFFSQIIIPNKIYAATGAQNTAGAHTSKTDQANQVSVVSASSNWSTYYRYDDENARKSFVQNAIAACDNNVIGYSQDYRETFYNQLKQNNYDASKITTQCWTDCSAFVAAIIIATGHQLNNSTLQSIDPNNDTDSEDGNLRAIGFTAHSFNGLSELQPGDVLLRSGHTEFYVGDGTGTGGTSSGGSSGSTSGGNASYTWTPSEIDDTVNLDEINFDFAGNPKHVTYLGKRKIATWVFTKIAEFLEYIVSLLLNGIKYSILGYAMAFESIINNAMKALEGKIDTTESSNETTNSTK